MYTDFNKLKESLTEATLLFLTNDEQRIPLPVEEPPVEPDPETYYDLTDENDPIVIRVNEAIIKACAEIDSYLRGRFTLPVSETPIVIEELANRKTIKRLLERRHKTDMPEAILIQDKEDTKYLMEIQKGNINPGITEQEDRSGSIITTNQTTKQKIFTDDYLKDY